MQYTRLGRTEAMVSVAGLGCGGHSRLGMARGASTDEAAAIVRKAIDLGVTVIDTAAIYGTEEAVGRAIAGHDRDALFLSTKSLVGQAAAEKKPQNYTPAEFTANLEASLRRLGTDHVDLFHLHGVSPDQLPYVLEVLVPELHRQRDAGKLRFIGITEVFRHDTDHAMLRAALPTGAFDVAMVGFNLLNPGARHSVFPLATQNDVGTLIMFAVRRALNSPANTREAIGALVEAGAIDPALVDRADPLGFLAATPGVASQIEAAYRFCRHEPGADVVLTGTGSAAHLEQNIAAILAPPLPDEALARLNALFGQVTSASGD